VSKGIAPSVIAIAAGILVLVILVVRARRLRVEYSVLWIAAALLVLVATVFYSSVEFIAPYLGVVYTPSAVFFLGILFLLLVTFHLSVKVSRLEEDRTRMAQTVALLEERLRRAAGEEPPPAANGE
jgi:hypothetical protein